MSKISDYQLYLVTDRRMVAKHCDAISLEAAVEQAILGGVTMVQLREKQLNSKAFFEQALAIKHLCHSYHVPLLINDRVDIALAVNADGVHIGQEDLPADIVRKLIGKDKILGVTAKTTDQAKLAQGQGADYLGVGAVFGTTTKADAKAITLDELSQICQAVSIPVVAIGGITYENIDKLQDIGIAGVAVVSGILGQADIQKASGELRDKIKTLQILS